MDYLTLILMLVMFVAIQRLWHRLSYKKDLTKEESPLKIDEEEFNKLNEKQEKGEYIKICSKCGSINIIIDFSTPETWAAGFPVLYKCKDCNYGNITFPEVKKDKIREFRANLKKINQHLINQPFTTFKAVTLLFPFQQSLLQGFYFLKLLDKDSFFNIFSYCKKYDKYNHQQPEENCLQEAIAQLAALYNVCLAYQHIAYNKYKKPHN